MIFMRFREKKYRLPPSNHGKVGQVEERVPMPNEQRTLLPENATADEHALIEETTKRRERAEDAATYAAWRKWRIAQHGEQTEPPPEKP